MFVDFDLPLGVDMKSLCRELVFLMLQFLDEEKFKETIHKLEQESGFFFNMKYFEDMVTGGEWEEVERYLSGFTKVDDNRYSMKIFFEIRKQKYLEALDKHDRAKAVEILAKELKVFSAYNEELFTEIAMLLALENFRENEQLSNCGDTESARGIMLIELKKLIEANPLFRDKLQYPNMMNSRLRILINQSLNWQHQRCENPKPNPEVKTLLFDHICGQPNGATNLLMETVPNPGGFSSLSAHGPFQQALVALPTIPSPLPHPSASTVPKNAAATSVQRPRTPPTNNSAMDYPTANSALVLKRPRPFGTSNEGNKKLCVNVMPVASVAYPNQSQGLADLPRSVVYTTSLGSLEATSMDFHSAHQNVLLVGTSTGDIMIYEIPRHESVARRKFKVWDLGSYLKPLQELLASDKSVSVNRVLWSPDGGYVAVAYSKHLFQMYTYHGGNDLRPHLEIEAHVGSVNDLAFSYPNRQISIVTCGDDRLIKVWDAVLGTLQYTFEGHEAPVHCVRPHQKDKLMFVFSTATDGKIKAWLYDNMGSRLDYDAPGRSTTTMAYTADGTRLFSCGTNKEGDSFLVEWNDSDGNVKRTFQGLGNRSVGIVKFDTSKNRILAVGDESMVKFWDMDNVNLMHSTDADGGLPASPCIRFNKAGSLLAVSTNENGIKILANTEGIEFLRSMDTAVSSIVVAKPPPSIGTIGSSNISFGTSIAVKPRITDESLDKARIWKPTEINEPTQCRSMRLPDRLTQMRVSRLIYTKSGVAILALASDAVHKLWKWPESNDQNASVKATTSVAPQLWQPSNGMLMTNDISNTNPEEAVPCFALSKNDSYVMSASGGQISLFNMMTFKTMTTFMPPPPTATFLAFYPQDNNIIAIGMEDSTILIYNVRADEVKTKLKGHRKRITGLAFSQTLNVLVSSGADSQLCVWNTDGWERQMSKFLQLPAARTAGPTGDTRVEFHQDQTHLLAVHETQIAIYEAPKLECLKQWFPREATGPITHATYSCDSSSIYVSFEDGSISVLTASSLRLRCRINATSYLPQNPSSRVYPLVIAAHPKDANQFAVGLTDGGVHILEPLESEAKWGTDQPQR